MIIILIFAKVLADRISLPCTLVRSEYNRAWNEVWLPDETMVPLSTYIIFEQPFQCNMFFSLIIYFLYVCNWNWNLSAERFIAVSGAQVHCRPDARSWAPSAGQLAWGAAVHAGLSDGDHQTFNTFHLFYFTLDLF